MPSISKSIVATMAILAVIAVAAPIDTEERAVIYTPPAGSKKFQLMTLAVGDSPIFDGAWVSTFHTGAGEAVIVLTYNQSAASVWQFRKKSGDIYFTVANGQTPFPESIQFLDASPYMSNAPAGYKLVANNIGYGNSSLTFDPAKNENHAPAGYGTYAACQVNGTAPYFSAGPQMQLFWHADNITTGKNCADVKLKAVD